MIRRLKNKSNVKPLNSQAMKKVIIISMLMLAGIALQAQSGGGPTVLDSYKCYSERMNKITVAKMILPVIPYSPVVPWFPKPPVDQQKIMRHKQEHPHVYIDRINEACPTEPRKF